MGDYAALSASEERTVLLDCFESSEASFIVQTA